MEIFIIDTNFEYAQSRILYTIHHFAEQGYVYPSLRGTLSDGLDLLRYESSPNPEDAVDIRLLASDEFIPLNQCETKFIWGIGAVILDHFTFSVSCIRRWDAVRRDIQWRRSSQNRIGHDEQHHMQDQNWRSVADLQKEAEILLDYVMVTWKMCSGKIGGHKYKAEDENIIKEMIDPAIPWSYKSNRYASKLQFSSPF